MNSQISWRAQLALSLLVGLGLGWCFQPAPPTPVSPAPKAWFVQVRFSQFSAPVIEKVTLQPPQPPLSYSPGPAQIELLDASGQVLFNQTFELNFGYEDLPTPVSVRVLTFILPAQAGAASIRIRAPQGETRYDLP